MGLCIHLRKRLPLFDLRLDLSCPRGTLTAIVGPSGAGKSTLIRLVAGLETPDWGRIELGGRVLFDKAAGTDMPTRKRRIGMVFQDYPLFSHLTVEKNVAFSCADKAMVDALLTRFGIRRLARRKPEAISGGERQRAAIARALVNSPALVLADEPTGNLDASSARNVRDLLFGLSARGGTTLIVVTHDEGLARQADLAYLLEGGALRPLPPAEAAP